MRWAREHGVAAALVTLVAVAVVITARIGDREWPQSSRDRQDVEEWLAGDPGVALVLPTDLHEDYRLRSLRSHLTRARFVDFGPRREAGSVTDAVLCVGDPGRTEPLSDICPGVNAGAEYLERSLHGHEVLISFYGTPTSAERSYWATTPLTLELEEVSWLE